MALTPYSASDLQYTIPELYSGKVEREFEANLLAGAFFKDKSGAFVAGGDTLNVPDIYSNTMSVNTKSVGSDVTVQSPAQGNTTLSVDTWKEISYVIEDKQLQQIMRDSDVLEGMASQAGYHVAKAYDTAILALYSGASQTVNDTASDVADQDIRSSIKTLENNDVRLDQAAFFVHPTVFWDDLMGLSKYTDVYDSDPVVTGMLGGASASRTRAYKGDLYDVPIFTTTNIQEDGASSAFYNLLATPQAFMHASQTPGGNSVRSQSSYEHPQLGTLWTNDSIFGVAELRDEAVVVVKSRQSGIVS